MHEHDRGSVRTRVLSEATLLFLSQGYDATTIRRVAAAAQVSPGTVQSLFYSKEDILCALVEYVFNSQFAATEKLLSGVTEDKILLYAAETTLQLYMAESSEAIRSLYAAAYSLPKPSAVIRNAITEKLQVIFGEYLPTLKTSDFFRLEIASGGIMRGFMTTPCTMWFTMDMKIESFLQTTFRVYLLPEEKTREAINFVSRFDFASIAKQTVDSILKFAETGHFQN